jgi:hypothetical protein
MFSQERGGCEYREAKVRKDEETGWDVSSEPLSSDCFSLSESQSEVRAAPRRPEREGRDRDGPRGSPRPSRRGRARRAPPAGASANKT